MHVLIVQIHVKPEAVTAFKEAIEDNAANSRKEPGVVRFDVLQQVEDPTRFLLVEVYRTPADHASHRETPHYNRWREAVVDMMAEDRIGTKYVNLSPADEVWGA